MKVDVYQGAGFFIEDFRRESEFVAVPRIGDLVSDGDSDHRVLDVRFISKGRERQARAAILID